MVRAMRVRHRVLCWATLCLVLVEIPPAVGSEGVSNSEDKKFDVVELDKTYSHLVSAQVNRSDKNAKIPKELVDEIGRL